MASKMCPHKYTEWCHLNNLKNLIYTALLKKGQLCLYWITTDLTLSLVGHQIYIVGRGFSTSQFYEDSRYIVYPSCFLILTPLPTHTHTHTHTHTPIPPALFVALFHTHKQIHTARTGASRLAHPYNILTPPVLCSQQLSVLHWMNNSIIIINNSKIYFTEFHNGFAFWKFLLICWLNSVRLSSSNETQRILIDMVTVNTTRPPPPTLFYGKILKTQPYPFFKVEVPTMI